jgi:hypothetical protein
VESTKFFAYVCWSWIAFFGVSAAVSDRPVVSVPLTSGPNGLVLSSQVPPTDCCVVYVGFHQADSAINAGCAAASVARDVAGATFDSNVAARRAVAPAPTTASEAESLALRSTGQPGGSVARASNLVNHPNV